VFVQQLDHTSQFFSVDGRWAHSRLARVAFAIPGCIDPALLQPLLPFLPTIPDEVNPKGDIHVPSEVAAPILKVLDDMTEKAERVYRANAPILDTAYADLADPDRTRMMTLAQIARTLLGRNDPKWSPSPAALLAVRKALLHNEFRFRSDTRSHRMTNVFAIRPKNDVQVVETVHEWVREYREHLAASVNSPKKGTKTSGKGVTYVTDFIDKARRLIANSRKDRDANLGNVGPSKTRFSLEDNSTTVRPVFGERFSSSDKQIIQFLQAWVLTKQFENISGLHAACTSLVMSTGCYEPGKIQHTRAADPHVDAIQRSTGALFLQEIGVITPYENLAVYDEQLMLPTIRRSRNLELLNTKAEILRKDPDFQDSMAGMRRDWGEKTVYCIDDAGAHEIDDGISVERVKNTNSEYWIHVHVANPTAFFGKAHTLSGLAAHMGETVYTPERVFPMLPLWAVEGFFSMQRNRPVITFSSRVDSSGNVLETKIEHGTVHYVVSITPSELSTVLGDKTTLEKRKLVVGGQLPPRANERSPPKLDSKQILELQDMYGVARTLWEKRKAAGSIRITSGDPSVRVYENKKTSGLTWNEPSLDAARSIQGDPIIEFTNTIPKRHISFDMNATNIVEEMMILAGQSAASWCAERNISVMYRGTIEMPNSNGVSMDDFKQQTIEPYLEKHGDLSLVLASKYMSSRGRAVAHFSPLPHKTIGVASYAKVTSPLRRFSDMMSHWQIEAAIRYEARTGKKLNAAEVDTSESGLPFSQRQMQDSIVTLQPKEVIIRQTKRNSVKYWTALAFMRAFHYKEAELPATFRCWVSHVHMDSRPLMGGAVGQIPEYGLQVTMMNEVDAREGDEWEVAIDTVDLFRAQIYVKPVRLLHREAELL
jgi:hypothetical protein